MNRKINANKRKTNCCTAAWFPVVNCDNIRLFQTVREPEISSNLGADLSLLLLVVVRKWSSIPSALPYTFWNLKCVQQGSGCYHRRTGKRGERDFPNEFCVRRQYVSDEKLHTTTATKKKNNNNNHLSIQKNINIF